MTSNADSIAKRSGVSILANAARAFIGLLNGILLARWLGPESYGTFAFLTVTFLAVRQLTDMGSSNAFFTFLSGRKRSLDFILFYWLWLLAQAMVLTALILVVIPNDLFATIWGDNQRLLVMLAFLATFMQGSVWTAVSQMGESERLTIAVQAIATCIMIVHLVVLVNFFIFDYLTLPTLFIAISLEWLVGSVFLLYIYFTKSNKSLRREDNESFKSIFSEYCAYCIPFIPYAIVGFFHDFLDRWMLQTWSGSKEQAYFALAQQISTLSMLAIASILRIFWKEVSEAKENKDFVKLRLIYETVTKMMFVIATSVSLFMIPFASDLILLTVGSAYLSGSDTLIILLLYPSYQALGQICGTMFLATGMIRINTIIGVCFMLAGLIVTYLLLAPSEYYIPGLNLASKGLALKMVILQFIQVNIMSIYIAHFYKWQFHFIHHVGIFLGCLLLGFTSKYFVSLMINSEVNIIFEVAFSSIIYFGIIFSLIYKFPSLVGLGEKSMLNIFLKQKTS